MKENCWRVLRNGCRHRRTGQHPFGGGGQTEFCPNGFSGGRGGGSSRNFPGSVFSGGGGVVAEIFPGSIFCGVAGFFPLTAVTDPKFVVFSVNSRNRPSIRVIKTCIVFCPNNVDSLPEFMSTNCPNWGGGQLPPLPPLPPPSRTPMVAGEQHGDIESRTGSAWYGNRKETYWGQGDMVVERWCERCDKS